ncbi:MAG: AI-2E family transporter [Flavobacteriales bacterium]
MNERRTTNILLLIIAIPVFFYVLKTLSFIFIPLTFSMFVALLFLPLMRWLKKKNVPKTINITIIVIVILGFFKITGEAIQLSSQEILTSENDILSKAEAKLEGIILPIEKQFGISRPNGTRLSAHYLKGINMSKAIGTSIKTFGNVITMTLMTFFFALLLIAESINFQKILNRVVITQKFSSVKVFRQIEKDLITFTKVKFVMSFFTGVGFTLSCYFFDVSFPIFWGLFAFSINFVQTVGSFVSVILLSLFAFVELDTTSVFLFFVLCITMVQVVMGGILEPIFMGKSFSINVVTILIMLMFWGYIWGVPGMILSIPITAFTKIILEHFPRTKVIADLMAGQELIPKNLTKPID